MTAQPPTGLDQSDDLVPLFSLAPEQQNFQRRPPAGSENAHLARTSLFGYDCRLDEATKARRPLPTYSSRNNRKRSLVAVTLVSLAAAVGLMMTQPGARQAMAGLFGGGGNTQSAPQATPASQVLGTSTAPMPTLNDIVTPAPTAIPSPTVTPAPTVMASPTAAATTSAPTTAPSPAVAPPVYKSGSFVPQQAPVCEMGTSFAHGCAWSATVAAGYPIYTQLQWQGAGTVTLTLSTPAGKVLAQSSSSSGQVALSVANPPSPTVVTVSETTMTTLNFSVGFAGHSF